MEYLLTGIPPSIRAEGGVPVDEDSPVVPAAGEGGASDENPLAFLRNQEEFLQMKRLLQQNPSMLNALLQHIGQSNPELLQVISQNQEAFIRMINEPEDGGRAGGSGGRAGEAGQGLLGESGVIQVSPQDKEAIERVCFIRRNSFRFIMNVCLLFQLKALGFPEHLVVQAYFACEKNENLAANFLLSQNFDD